MTERLVLRSPMAISPRLMPAVQIGDVWVSIQPMRQYDGGRTVWHYFIDGPDLAGFGDDLASVQMWEEPAAEFQRRTLADLFGFLSDVPGNFDALVAEWARREHDAISLMLCELQDDTEGEP